MALSYREMEVPDLPAMFSVRLATIENAVTMAELEKDYGITPSYLARAMQADVHGWLCEDGGKVVGISMGERANGEVQVVAVLPDYEDRGIGSTLLSYVRDWLFEQRHEEIWLLANPDSRVRATGFYKHLGWVPSGATRGGDQVLELKKTVNTVRRFQELRK